MCGITGYWLAKPDWTDDKHQTAIKQMGETLAARGPDDRGSCWDRGTGLAFAHRRLAVRDLTKTGRQPMVSQNGRFLLIYNGEIYNAAELQQALLNQGCSFNGTSDTEVLLEGIANWGLEETLQQANGMFAFAVWDRQQKKLTLARDRIGIKPLYYGWQNDNLLFASELKAIKRFPSFQSTINPDAVTEFFKVGYIPAPLSIEKNIFKLKPGTSVTFQHPHNRPTPDPFWSLQEEISAAQKSPARLTEAEAVDQLEELVSEAIDGRLVSDVPVGAFLSGGIDSSLVVALMQKHSSRKVKTFSIGFEEPEYNEAGYAQDIAAHLKTDHHELIVDSQTAQDVIPKLVGIYDEPFADSSQIPTFLVSQFARQEVTVSLSGDGGDELFGGYRRYPHFVNMWSRANQFPQGVKGFASTLLEAVSKLPLSTRYRRAVKTRAKMLGINSFADCYEQFNRHWRRPAKILQPDFLATDESILKQANFADSPNGWVEWMMYCDLLQYLPDDILTKVDRASMANSLEVRVPLLDHKIIEWSWTLPGALKQGTEFQEASQTGKVILRKLLEKHVPKTLFERPKIGFGVPIDQWLRGPLRDWAEELLSTNRLNQTGILKPKQIRKLWDEHLTGQADWQYLLWDVLMFQAYLDENATLSTTA